MPTSFRAMRLDAASRALECRHVSTPKLAPTQVLIRVMACGVCRTDLHLLDGELPQARYPVTPGHEIVGRVVARGAAVTEFGNGDRVGVPWLGGSCGTCDYCMSGRENLCDRAEFTGCTLDGGYAEYAVADAHFCLAIPARYTDAEAAPLLCAGLIGYRAFRAAGDARVLGLYGFGAAAHLIAQVAVAQGRRVVAFTRPGDAMAQGFARELLFAPVGALVPAALAATRKGGRVVCAGIHMSDIPSFPYSLLWGERRVESVANLTHRDGLEFMRLAAEIDLRPTVQTYALEDANRALAALRAGELRGAAVLVNS
jgi:propanol-preferring alcohol dehydrogenase